MLTHFQKSALGERTNLTTMGATMIIIQTTQSKNPLTHSYKQRPENGPRIGLFRKWASLPTGYLFGC